MKTPCLLMVCPWVLGPMWTHAHLRRARTYAHADMAVHVLSLAELKERCGPHCAAHKQDI